MKTRNFRRNSVGNVAITFALSIVPLIVGVGAAIDLMRQNNANTILQSAVDAAILAGAASHLSSKGEIDKIVLSYIKANDGFNIMSALSDLTITADSAGGVYTVRLTGKLDTSFLALAGIPNMDVGAFSEVRGGSQAAEIALVLDNTGSMGREGRMTALKAAAINLVDKVMQGKQAGSYLKIGIVPFSDYVNVGTNNRNNSWMNVTAAAPTIIKNYCTTTYPNAVSSNCHDVQDFREEDGGITAYTRQVCEVDNGAPVTTCAYKTVMPVWNGCVGSRNSPFDTSIASPSLRYPAIMDTTCPLPVTPLTDDTAVLHGAIGAMQAVGETYIPAGLLWGWNVLDAGVPFTEAKTDDQMKAINGTKFLVLMTDGENTRSPIFQYHYGTDKNLANSKMTTICSNIKQAGITVYTVGFKVDSSTAKDLLQSCASDSSKAFDAADDAALQASFYTIAKQLATLRLSK